MTAAVLIAAAVAAANVAFVIWGYLHHRATHGKGE
jgi:hypothetical protein